MEAFPLIVISAPSGTGKTTMVRHLLALEPRLAFTISHTTRAPRKGEVHGRDYYFVRRAEFESMIRRHAFLEWAEVHGALYGTGWEELERIRSQGKIPVLDIDVQGAAQVQRKAPQGLFIMLIPPDWHTLEHRLRERGDLDSAEIDRRVQRAREEVQYWWMYDHVVVNDDLDTTMDMVHSIVKGYLTSVQVYRMRGESPVRALFS